MTTRDSNSEAFSSMTEGDRPGRRSPHREDELRLGCVCACCDHSEGSDCSCDCHEKGRCSSTSSPGPQARTHAGADIKHEHLCYRPGCGKVTTLTTAWCQTCLDEAVEQKRLYPRPKPRQKPRPMARAQHNAANEESSR